MNDIEHDQAHDALADVKATIDLARLVKKAATTFGVCTKVSQKLICEPFLKCEIW